MENGFCLSCPLLGNTKYGITAGAELATFYVNKGIGINQVIKNGEVVFEK